MATSNQLSNSATKSSDSPTSRWSRSSDSGHIRPSRGRSNRPRNSGRSSRGTQNAREDQPPKPTDGPTSSVNEKPPRPLLPEKPTLSVTPPSNPPSATKPRHSSRRPSRANSTLSTSHSSPVLETPVSPSSSRSSNRRKRSGTGRGNNIPKINPPPPQDDLLRPGRPRVGAVPHTAPIKDTPPHLVPKPPRTPQTSSFDMSKDIDALVERVRAVAMADNRPSTPGSHIDWAGDDDDSLPDLDDWGITSLSTPDPKTSIISPIIVGGLKPLPEFTSSNETKPGDQPTGPHDPPSHPPQPIEGILPDAASASQPPSEEVADQAGLSEVSESVKPTVPADEAQDPEASGDQDPLGSGGLAQSIHAPTGSRASPDKEGLTASIHAPRAIVDSSSAPALLGAPRNRQQHARAHTVGRPFPRPNPNDSFNSRSPRNGRGGFHGSPRQHMRNHSSPAAANRPAHSRPVLTGDAISRLAKVVGSTTTPPAKSTPITND